MFSFLWSCMWLSVQVSIGGLCWSLLVILVLLGLTMIGMGGGAAMAWIKYPFRRTSKKEKDHDDD